MKASPRYHTSPSGAPNRLAEVSAVAEAMGMPLLPWVERAVEVSTEYEVTDLGQEPLRRQVLWTVPRQSGKSVALAAIAIEQMRRKPDQHGIYMAQNRLAATNRLKGMTKMLKQSGLDPGHKATFGVGNERLTFSNGSVLQVLPPTDNAAHGESLDAVYLDELFAIDPFVMQGVSPAMAARPEAQLLGISTQGTLADSQLLNEMTARGREDPEGELCFVEYSKPDKAHPLDEDGWWLFHPGLGYTVTLKHMRSEAKTMKMGDFARAYCNIATAQETDAIPPEWWAQAARVLPVPQEIALAVDASGLGVSVASAFQTDEGWHADLAEWRPTDDTSWVEGRLRELVAKFDVQAVALDHSGPISSLAPTIKGICEDEGIAYRQLSLQDRSRADHHLYGLLRDGSMTHAPMEALDEAVATIGTQTTGDLWRFSRGRSVGDPAPLIAVSCAMWALYEVVELAEPVPAFHAV